MLKKLLNTFCNYIKYNEKFQIHLKRIKNEEQNIKNITQSTVKKTIKILKKKIKKNGITKYDKYKIFALVKKAAKKTLFIDVYDVQLYGSWLLLEKNIIEMKTGEGKTLTAVFAAVTNYINSKKTHIATTNDYLAKRDAKWMEPLYNFLGIQITYLMHNITLEKKKKIYKQDIIYGTCNEFVFNYLKNNIILEKKYYINIIFDALIIDEIDSILIDEAQTPLIIADNKKKNVQNKETFYILINTIVKNIIRDNNKLNKQLFIIDKKKKEITLTDHGYKEIETACLKYKILRIKKNLYEKEKNYILNAFINAFKANIIYKKNIHYIVQKKKILIIDEYTGRILPNRRWGDDLHQAIETKENVIINPQTEIIAIITFQKYVKLYKYLSGMTGTAKTDEVEFKKIFNLKIKKIPTNKPFKQFEHNDLIYLSKKEKIKRILTEISYWYKKKRPILIGTISINMSIFFSNLLKKIHIDHFLLNAMQTIKEIKIIATAGLHKSVTVTTNIAGRGTDILLGGSIFYILNKYRHIFNKLLITYILKQIYIKIKCLGGLYIIGTERHNLRRLDNQLKGRCARQGNPGGIQFYLSLEDDLLKIFLQQKNPNFLKNFIFEKNISISHKTIDMFITHAQKNYEYYNYSIRKYLINFDEIFDEQRTIFYQIRQTILLTENKIQQNYYIKKNKKKLLLYTFNECWKTHLLNLTYLKKTIFLQNLIGKNSLDYYKKESYKLFIFLIKKLKILNKSIIPSIK